MLPGEHGVKRENRGRLAFCVNAVGFSLQSAAHMCPNIWSTFLLIVKAGATPAPLTLPRKLRSPTRKYSRRIVLTFTSFIPLSLSSELLYSIDVSLPQVSALREKDVGLIFLDAIGEPCLFLFSYCSPRGEKYGCLVERCTYRRRARRDWPLQRQTARRNLLAQLLSIIKSQTCRMSRSRSASSAAKCC